MIAYPPRVPLARTPTPLQLLQRASDRWGCGKRIWIKRDDLTGSTLSGNKVRKLEYLAAEAIDTGCDTLVSIGGIQSNHTRQVTGVAAKLGLKAVTVQEGWVDYNDMAYDKVGNIQLTRNGEVKLLDFGVALPLDEALTELVGTPPPDHPWAEKKPPCHFCDAQRF